jgi:hypothetical protein
MGRTNRRKSAYCRAAGGLQIVEKHFDMEMHTRVFLVWRQLGKEVMGGAINAPMTFAQRMGKRLGRCEKSGRIRGFIS